MIESEENYFDLGLGFFQVDKDFFTVKEVKRDELYDKRFNSTLECTFFMDNDRIVYRRQVYTFWEFFGEVGGL